MIYDKQGYGMGLVVFHLGTPEVLTIFISSLSILGRSQHCSFLFYFYQEAVVEQFPNSPTAFLALYTSASQSFISLHFYMSFPLLHSFVSLFLITI